MHQVVVAQLAHRRAGTQKTKGRAEVSGGGKKPFSQKGTGNARQGSIRAPHFVGGAVTLGPTPRKYGQRTPKKMVQLALRSALSDRANDGKLLVVVKSPNGNEAKSFRNLADVQVVMTSELNAYDVLVNDWVVFSQDSLPKTDGGAK
jgi:large subunit ribosomal protein L4